MGNQQNPDGIYVPPGNTSRYPLEVPKTPFASRLDRMPDETFPREGEGDDE